MDYWYIEISEWNAHWSIWTGGKKKSRKGWKIKGRFVVVINRDADGLKSLAYYLRSISVAYRAAPEATDNVYGTYFLLKSKWSKFISQSTRQKKKIQAALSFIKWNWSGAGKTLRGSQLNTLDAAGYKRSTWRASQSPQTFCPAIRISNPFIPKMNKIFIVLALAGLLVAVSFKCRTFKFLPVLLATLWCSRQQLQLILVKKLAAVSKAVAEMMAKNKERNSTADTNILAKTTDTSTPNSTGSPAAISREAVAASGISSAIRAATITKTKEASREDNNYLFPSDMPTRFKPISTNFGFFFWLYCTPFYERRFKEINSAISNNITYISNWLNNIYIISKFQYLKTYNQM